MPDRMVVIIGGGMAGLTAAAYLARAGFSVKIFEQHSQPGGYVSSFTRKGFTFPAGPASFGSNGIIFPILAELGLTEKLQFIRAGHQISWDAHDVPLQSPAQTRRELEHRFPDEKTALRRYFRWVTIGGSAFHDSLKGGMMFGRGVIKTMLRVILKHPLSPWALWVAGKNTNRSLHAHYFKNGTLRQLLDRLGYPVMSGRNTLGMWASYYHDTWVPKGGMQAFADLIARYIREHGGEVRLGTRVGQIRIENGQAAGVELQDGNFVPAAWVVSAADLYQTCFRLIGRGYLLPAMIGKLEKARPSESMFTLFLGLNNSPALSSALKRFKESHVGYTCDGGQYIKLIYLSKDDPSSAPEGKHTLLIACLSPYEDWEDLKGSRQAYQARKAAYTDMLIKEAEEFLPGLSAHIAVMDTATPLTCERYTANWRGSTAGWNWDPKDAPHFDLDKDLPVKRLYPIGHTVHNPGGVPTAMITAWYIAGNIMRQAGKL
jgi:prolycopene isomerase